MNILIDINHPAHVHLMRNVYKLLVNDGHKVLVTVKEIPSAIKLLELYDIPYVNIGKKDDAIVRKGFDQLEYDRRIRRIVKEHDIELGVGSSINIPHVSKMSQDEQDEEHHP